MDLLNNPNFPLLVFLSVFFLGFIIYLPEAVPGFIFISFASMGVIYEVTNIQKIVLLKAVFLPLMMIVLLITKLMRRQHIPWVNLILLVLFVCAVLMSMSVNALSFEVTRPYIGTLLIALVVVLSPNTEKTAKYTFIAFTLWGLLNLMATVSQLAGQGWVYRGDAVHTGFRVQGLMGTSTMMGVYFVISLIGAHVLYLTEKRRTMRIVLFCLGSFFALGVLGTLSRASIIAGALSFLIIQSKLGKLKASVFFGIVATLAVVLSLAALLNLDEMTIGRFSVIQRDPSSQDRFRLMDLSLKYIENNPFLGLGLSQGGLEAKYVIINSHNTFLQRLIENGILGLTLFLILIWRAIRGFRKQVAGDASRKPAYNYGLLVILIAILVNGLFHDFSYLMPLWLVIGLGLIV